MVMEENCKNGLQFIPLASNWTSQNTSGALECQKYINTQGTDGICQIPVAAFQWVHPQGTPQNYVHFLSDGSCSDISKVMSYSMPPQPKMPVSELKDHYQLEHYAKLHLEGNVNTQFASMEHPTVVQNKGRREECTLALQAYLGSSAAESQYPSEGCRKRARERAYATDRYRRLRISVALEALQELVPHSEEVGGVDCLDSVIEHVKNLQYQVKDLCRARLGGESVSNSFILVEGHGHYIVQEHMLIGPFEEMIGKLIDVYPSAVTELLQSRGLVVMPINFAEGLGEPVDMLNMDGKHKRVHFQYPSDHQLSKLLRYFWDMHN